MNKYLMLSTAMVLGAVTSAGAADKKYATVCFNGSPGIDLVYIDPFYHAHYLSTPGGGFGIALKTKGEGKHVLMSDNDTSLGDDATESFDLTLPLKNGGTWGLYIEYSGTTSFEADSGTYTLCDGKPSENGTIQTKLKNLIAELKNRKPGSALEK